MSRHRAPEPEKKSAPDGVSPVMAAIAILCVLGLAVTLVLMSGSDRVSGPMNVNGDFAGPENGESVADYAARASESLRTPPPLADGSAAEEGAEHWALLDWSRWLHLAKYYTNYCSFGMVKTVFYFRISSLMIKDKLNGRDERRILLNMSGGNLNIIEKYNLNYLIN